MMGKKDIYHDIIAGMNATNRITSSQVSAYKTGDISDGKGRRFRSQEFCSMYKEGYEALDEEEQRIHILLSSIGDYCMYSLA